MHEYMEMRTGRRHVRLIPGEPWKAQIARALVFSGLGLIAAPAVWSIHEADLRMHVEYLASDELAGRATGEPGCERAAEYIAERFASWGLEPLPGQDDFYLEYALQRREFDVRRSRSILHAGASRHYGQLGREFRPFWFSGVGFADADVVFAGYGISAPELGHDDYAELDVRNKLVLVLRYEPGRDDPNSKFEGTQHSRHAFFETKARVAREHGALGMLLVTGPLHGRDEKDLGSEPRLTLASAESRNTFLAVHISQEWAAKMLAPLGTDLIGLHEALEAGLPPSEVRLPARMQLELEYGDPVEALRSANVAAFLPGSDPALRNEWIVVGAHHDHIGVAKTGRDRVFNGADDNASGTAVVLAMARKWARRMEPPRRSVVFVTFSGEERGLLGSRAFLEQERVPLEKVRFMMNFDMVGRNPQRPLAVFGDGTASGVREVVEAANEDVGLELLFHGRNVPRNSDHSTFYRRDIPIVAFFSGLHDDYHSVRDHADKLDYERMVDIAELGSGVLERLSAMEPHEFPVFSPPGFLGIQHAEVGSADRRRLRLSADEGVFVERVLANTPAQSAGLRRGDILVRIDERPVRDDNIVQRLGRIGADVEIELELLRGGERRRVRLVLARRPTE